jgi:hypothetical protein
MVGTCHLWGEFLIGLQNKPPNTTTTVIETLEVKMAQVVCSIESKEECVSCGS